ncbi:MAG: AI-2E family transporter [Schwartzia sp.]|nr:AI-2E family transporter [Schwartzia sp. (in: firmicutes)]
MWTEHRTSIFIALSFLLILSAFWLLPDLAFVVFIALLIDLLLHPLVDRLHRIRSMPRSLAAAISLLGFLALVVSLFTLLSSTLADSVQKFSHDLPEITANLNRLFEPGSLLSREIDELWTELASLSITAVKSSLTMLISLFTKIFDTVIILFAAFYLLQDGRQIQEWIARLFPAKDHLRVFRLFDRILRALHIYITSQLAICFLMGFIVFCYFSVRGLPYASVFAVVSGVSEFIPVIGPTIASAFGTALTAAVSPWIALQTMFFYLVITQVNHNFLYPYLVGRSLRLHPIVILLGILLGGSLLDTAGMFLAVPLIVILRLVVEDIHAAAQEKQCLPPAEPEAGGETAPDVTPPGE